MRALYVFLVRARDFARAGCFVRCISDGYPQFCFLQPGPVTLVVGYRIAWVGLGGVGRLYDATTTSALQTGDSVWNACWLRNAKAYL